jgi:hypothetical protein
MESGAHEVRLGMLEEKDATHERTHGRMWSKINENDVTLAVHMRHTDDVLERVAAEGKDIQVEVRTVKSRLSWLIGLVVIACFGLIGNLVMMVAERS